MSEPDFQNIPAYKPAKNEDFMSSNQIEHFKTSFLHGRNSLLAMLNLPLTTFKKILTKSLILMTELPLKKSLH